MADLRYAYGPRMYYSEDKLFEHVTLKRWIDGLLAQVARRKRHLNNQSHKVQTGTHGRTAVRQG